ncbi:MAG: hypothetical protein ABJA10_02690 [Aestuariivirga sp.]
MICTVATVVSLLGSSMTTAYQSAEPCLPVVERVQLEPAPPHVRCVDLKEDANKPECKGG